jgi:hypothetical protein
METEANTEAQTVAAIAELASLQKAEAIDVDQLPALCKGVDWVLVKTAMDLLTGTFSEGYRILAERSAEEGHEAYIEAARENYHRDGELEFDDPTVVSTGGDPGAYVQCWRWVTDEEAGVDRDADQEKEDGDGS